jgi:hypothetical protein
MVESVYNYLIKYRDAITDPAIIVGTNLYSVAADFLRNLPPDVMEANFYSAFFFTAYRQLANSNTVIASMGPVDPWPATAATKDQWIKLLYRQTDELVRQMNVLFESRGSYTPMGAASVHGIRGAELGYSPFGGPPGSRFGGAKKKRRKTRKGKGKSRSRRLGRARYSRRR